jgi:DNA helicase-2/ATP-dependent DNA helicase PcrA
VTAASRFLDEIPDEFLERSGGLYRPAPAAPPRRAWLAPGPRDVAAPHAGVDASGLRPGARVRHPLFGVGTVLRREGEGDDVKVTVSFPGAGTKKLVARYAGLATVD